jgi:hypothetical protein
MNDVIHVIPDLHEPFGHKDTVPFLTAVKAKYAPTRVVLLGDEADKQALKFHPRDPDLPSSGDELEQTLVRLAPLYKLYPKADVLESNHTSLAYRQAYANGISKKYLKSYREVLQAPAGWKWHQELVVTSGGVRIYFHHGLRKDIIKVVNRKGMCVVQGHFHSEFGVRYVGNGDKAFWGFSAGCLIDIKSPAFRYNVNDLERPILGNGIIVNGVPKPIPMILDRYGRWNGEIL